MRCVFVMVAILLFAGCDLRGDYNRRAKENNQKQLDLAIKNYEKSYRKVDDASPSGGVADSEPVSPPR